MASAHPSESPPLILAITGATGFVGTRLVEIAREAGHPIRALTRKWKPPEPGIDWIEGALDRPDSLMRLCDGADAMIHVAGLIDGRTRAAFEVVNVSGTANVIDAARHIGVRRFVHISSLAAREPQLADYGWSKERSERLVAASGLDWTTIRPPLVYGPGDRETLELFKMARRGLMLLPPGGRMSVIHVDDLSRLILAVVPEADTVLETYEPDDGTEHGWKQAHFAGTIGRALGGRPTKLKMPAPVMRLASRLDRLFRRDNAKLTADRVRTYLHPDWVVTADRKPPAALWYPEVRTPTGLKETAEWYREQGWLK